jgi:hypothetical protein
LTSFALSDGHPAILFDFLSNLKWPIRSDPGKEIGRRFVIEPSVNFDFVGPAQLPDLVFDLYDIHSYYSAFNVQLNWETSLDRQVKVGG